MPKAKIILFKSKTLSDGSHPIMIRCSNGNSRKYYSTKLKAKPDDLFGMRFKNSPRKNKVLNKIDIKLTDLMEAFHPLTNPFSFEKFERAYKGKKQTFSTFLDEKIETLSKSGKVGNSKVYADVRNTLKRFHKNEISFTDIDKRFLKKFVSFMQENGNQNATIYLKLRTLRAVLNDAELKPEQYPFKNQYNPHGFNIAEYKGQSRPRALKRDEIEKIKNLDLRKYPHLSTGKNLFMFSYWGRGINYTDMARLTIDNFRDDHIFYLRKKTSKETEFKLLAPAYEILRDFYNFPNSFYLFQILDENIHITEQQKFDRIQKKLKQFNKQLKEIARVCGIDKEITSYFARHSFASNLRFEGVSDAVISELLNHADASTTKLYLDSFGKEYLDEAQERLI